MKNLLITALGIAVFLGAGFLTWQYVKNQTPVPQVGAYNPTGGQTYRLQSSVGGSDTSLTLTSFKEPISNIKYTMSYLNSTIEYATIEPQSSSKEFISFTGITQNADGTATLTGLTRGLSFSYPYSASTTLQQSHSAQSILILSNPPQLYNQYAAKANDEYITGAWGFSQNATSTSDCTTSTQYCRKNYIDSVVVAGGVPANYTVPGLTFLVSGPTAASSTATTTYNTLGYANVLPAAIATDTPNTATRGSKVIMSLIGGYLNQAWLDLTENWTFSGAVNIAASAVKQLTLNAVAYTFPASQGVASSTLMNDGAGTLKWAPAPGLFYASTTPTAPSTNASTTIFAATIPANTLVGNAGVKVTVYFTAYQLSTSNNSNFDFAYGNASTTAIISNTTGVTLGAPNGMNGKAEFMIMANGATNSQISSANISAGTGAAYATSTIATGRTSTGSVDATQAQPLRLVFLTTNGVISFTPTLVTAEYIR